MWSKIQIGAFLIHLHGCARNPKVLEKSIIDHCFYHYALTAILLEKPQGQNTGSAWYAELLSAGSVPSALNKSSSCCPDTIPTGGVQPSPRQWLTGNLRSKKKRRSG